MREDNELEYEALTLLVHRVLLDVVEYTNRDYDDITMHMMYLMYFMVWDKYYSNAMVTGVSDDAMVKSVREGDVTVTKHTILERLEYLNKQSGIMDDYRHLLNKWRRVRK